MCGISARLAESFTNAVLEDDRVARRVVELRYIVEEEQLYIEGISPATWSRVAAVIGDVPMTEFR